MSQAYYMLVYCNDGQDSHTKFLMGIRNHEGYFFQKKRGGEVTLITPKAFAERQTPGKFVLPGGIPNPNTRGNHLNLANSEFMEETGVNLLDGYGVQPTSDVIVQTIEDRGQPAAHIVQVKLSNSNFQILVEQIKRNMDDKRKKINAIIDRSYKSTIHRCPILDDELSDVEVLETGTPKFREALQDMDTLDPGAGYKYRGWFAEGIVNCVNRIHNLNLATTFNRVSSAITQLDDKRRKWESDYSSRREHDGRRKRDDRRYRKHDYYSRYELDDRHRERDYYSRSERDNHRRRERSPESNNHRRRERSPERDNHRRRESSRSRK